MNGYNGKVGQDKKMAKAITETWSGEMKFSLRMFKMFKTLLVATGILAVVVMPLSAATVPASTACKECVTKCVMEDPGKLFNKCVSRYGPAEVCNTLCSGVDRGALQKELKDAAMQKCDTDWETCRTKAGDDRREQLLCEAALGSCRERTNGFYNIPRPY